MKKRTFSTLLFARACADGFFFVSLREICVFMDELIRHEGIVMRIEGDRAHISIVQTSACSACKARSMCMSSESQQKEVDAIMLEPMKVGDRVEVEVRERLAWRAVLLAYILPFVAMMCVMVLLEMMTSWSEAIVGTVSLCAIALYYIGLSMFRHRLQTQFSFTARKVNQNHGIYT